MVEQVLDFFSPASLKIYCDLTVGEGGHAEVILQKSSPDGKLVGFDRDAQVLDVAARRLSKFSTERFELIHSTFANVKKQAAALHIRGFDGILADFGFSSFQLDDGDRGFSFMHDGPLDMRMDRSQYLTASHVVNRSSAAQIGDILSEYGNERFARRIARAIHARAGKKRIETTVELARVVRGAAGRAGSGRIDAATRTFQALRIAVNDEMNELSSLMGDVFDLLNPGGVLVCISYHSMEDRIVKRAMADARKKSVIELLTPKPLRPIGEEIRANRRARSAKLRAALKRGRADG